MELEEAFEQDAQKLKTAVNPMTYINGINSVSNALDTLKKLFGFGGDSANNVQSSVNYSGQHTDIANISRYKDGYMPVDELDNIDNKDIRKNAKEEFSIAEKDGYIERCKVNGQDCYKLTEKGQEHINSERFVKQFETDQKNAMVNASEPKAVVNLNGNSDDLNIFRYTEKINIQNEPEKVQKYFGKCQQEGFVNIEDGIATSTEKTKEWLQHTPDKLKAKGNIKLVTADNMDELASKAVNKAAKPTTNTAVESAGKHFAQETTAAKATAKTATKAATKETGKAAAKTGAKAAATTAGAASGAATAGIGTIITIAVEAAQLLAKQQKKQTQEMTNMLRK